MIDEATRQRIIDSADIYEVISDYVALKKRTTLVVVRFITRRPDLSLSLRQKAYLSVLDVVRVAMLFTL